MQTSNDQNDLEPRQTASKQLTFYLIFSYLYYILQNQDASSVVVTVADAV